MAKNTIAKLAARQYINLDLNVNAHRVLIIGNTEGMFGQYENNKINNACVINSSAMSEDAYEAVQYFIDGIKNDIRFDIIGNEDTIKYYQIMMSAMIDMGFLKSSRCKQNIHTKTVKNDNEYLEFMSAVQHKDIKYDYIIQNPPYSGSLHLEFLKKGLELLEKNHGKMTIIEPATWLINVRKNGKAKKYDEIKKMLEGHVSKIVIENMNKEFGTGLYVPFAITYIDMNKTFDTIEFICCGEKKEVKSLYDCNLIGEYKTIWSILNKCISYKDMMKNHITKEKLDGDWWYTKYADIIGCGGCIVSDHHNGFSYESNAMYNETSLGNYMWQYTCSCYANKFNEISEFVPKRIKRGSTTGTLSDKNTDCIAGTKEQLENWKHFVFNNKLPLFINMVMTIDQHNNSLDYVPWLVDKQYNDEEINKLFNFTDEEIALIDKTIKKFERHSPWFKRYMCGKDSVSDEEVQKFIDSL